MNKEIKLLMPFVDAIAIYMTGLAPNTLAISTTKSQITWLGWLIAFLPAGIILFVLTPFLVYKIYPPDLKGWSIMLSPHR